MSSPNITGATLAGSLSGSPATFDDRDEDSEYQEGISTDNGQLMKRTATAAGKKKRRPTKKDKYDAIDGDSAPRAIKKRTKSGCWTCR